MANPAIIKVSFEEFMKIIKKMDEANLAPSNH
jgi:hypothetical protein